MHMVVEGSITCHFQTRDRDLTTLRLTKGEDELGIVECFGGTTCLIPKALSCAERITRRLLKQEPRDHMSRRWSVPPLSTERGYSRGCREELGAEIASHGARLLLQDVGRKSQYAVQRFSDVLNRQVGHEPQYHRANAVTLRGYQREIFYPS
jgi:hypothetical protein